MAFLITQILRVRAEVVGEVPGFPYFFRHDVETISQWYKFKLQIGGK